MNKLVGKIIVFFGILLILVAASGFWVKKNLANLSLASLISIMKGESKLELSQDDKESIKNQTQKAKFKIYEEATEHNPEGDVLPDEIDDKLKEQLKKEAKKRIE